MGQYYHPVIKIEEEANGKKVKRFVQFKEARDRLGGLKLMEHSWVGNSLTECFCKYIYKNPTVCGWIGDYADCLTKAGEIEDAYKAAWKSKEFFRSTGTMKFGKKFIVNHTQKVFLSEDKYLAKADGSGWIVHPVPLLICAGNGQGGGDYFSDACADAVGSWCLDKISIEDKSPESYTEIEVFFEE